MTPQTLKWRPRGPVGFAPLVVSASGLNAPGAFTFLACVDELKLENNLDYIEHKSKCAAIDTLDFRQPKSISSKLTITFSDLIPDAMKAALLAGSVTAEASATAVTNEVLPTVTVGQAIQLGGPHPATTITSASIVDSAGTPATLVSGTDYTLDAVYGFVTFLNVTGFTQPFNANYSHQNPLLLAGLKATPINRWVTFQGFNSANANKLVPVNFFNVSFSPSSLDFLPDELGLMTMEAALLIDTSRPSSDPLGQFYSVGLGV